MKIFFVSIYLFYSLSLWAEYDPTEYQKVYDKKECQVLKEKLDSEIEQEHSKPIMAEILVWKLKSTLLCEKNIDYKQIKDVESTFRQLKPYINDDKYAETSYAFYLDIFSYLIQYQNGFAFHEFQSFLSNKGGDFLLLLLSIFAGAIFAFSFKNCEQYANLDIFIKFLKKKNPQDSIIDKTKEELKKSSICRYLIGLKLVILSASLDIIIMAIFNITAPKIASDFGVWLWTVAVAVAVFLFFYLKKYESKKEKDREDLKFYQNSALHLDINIRDYICKNEDYIHLADLLQQMIVAGDIGTLRKAIYILEISDSSTFKDEDLHLLFKAISNSEHKIIVCQIFKDIKTLINEDITQELQNIC